jgi:hypothetical protein
MLFRPSPAQNILAIHAMLDNWNVEADHFRRVARAALKGEPPTALTTYAAQEMKEALGALLVEIEEALSAVAHCSRSFMDLTHAKATAAALLESVERSCDLLEGLPLVPIASPTRISHTGLRIAAE